MNNNKLIAEFMGMKYSDERSFDNGEWTHSIKSLSKFQTSWDWLMPVVLKCKESVDYCSDDNALKYHHIEDEMLSQLSIEDTYKAVVEFIKEHNNQDTEDEACDMLYGVDNNQ